MNKQKNKTEKSLFDQQIKLTLQQQLSKVISLFGNGHANQLILHSQKYREEKGLIFSLSLNGIEYLESHWKHFFDNSPIQVVVKSVVKEDAEDQHRDKDEQIYLPVLNLGELILKAAMQRQSVVQNQLREETLRIHPRVKPKKPKTNQNQIIIEKPLDQSKASQNSQKDFKQFIKNQKAQKQRRRKLLQKQHLKELQLLRKKQQQQQKARNHEQTLRLQQRHRRQKQMAQKRQRSKQLVQKHQSQYSQFQTRLYHSRPKQLSPIELFHQLDAQKLKHHQQQRKRLYKSFQKPHIDEHQKFYLQNITKKTQERHKRFQSMRQLQQVEKEKSGVRYQSSYKFERPQDEYQRVRREEYQRAKEKRDRILQYKNKVRSSYVPEVDQQKKRQLLKLIEDLDQGKKVKKRVMKNGEVLMERLEVKDSKEVGLNYLQGVKKMVEKMREMKRLDEGSESSRQLNLDQQNSHIKKPIDYLKQLRENKPKPSSSAFPSARKASFTNTKSSQMLYEEKLKKLQNISQKLLEKTRQEEMLLKHGKFKTSEEIMDKKELIDRNYIELVNLKLQMIENQQ